MVNGHGSGGVGSSGANTSAASSSGSGDPIARANTPPSHTTLSARSITTMKFGQMRPKKLRTSSNTVAWNFDGKKLLSCGLERGVRGWPLDNDSFSLRSTSNSSPSIITFSKVLPILETTFSCHHSHSVLTLSLTCPTRLD
ncbi:hypothetical protein DL93DRAFT_723426 [Clavulina sp. PMI_390]|nr:hypothetical protein DL93DRAFT_723426 [Clavulina sp. PMI_390]